ncbi:MAG: hypothetical protein MW689_001554 [Thermodesulfobacteria bacterium]|nr:hypothetical protein [Thermodesulfobacteriota bacterium]MCU4137983.1 hypothetical protein [Thermodesulfobacteriota bacterium]
MNILICMCPYPFFRAQGQTLRVYNIAKHLAKRHKLFLLGITDDSLKLKNSSLVFEIKDIFEKIFEIKVRRKKFIEILNLLTPRYSINLEFPIIKKKLYKLISQIIKKEKIDILHINGSLIIDLLLADFKGIPKILDLCDSYCLSFKRALKNTSQILERSLLFFKYLRIKAIEKYPY